MTRRACGPPQGLALGPLLPISAVSSLRVELSRVPGLHHASFTDGLTFLTPYAGRDVIQTRLQSALSRVARWTLEHCVRPSVSGRKHTLFAA